MFYERNGECHALPYEPGVGVVPDPSLVEYGTGGPNFLVNRDAWCRARHSTTNWKKKKVSAELEATQKSCDRYQKGWPRLKDGRNLVTENGEHILGIDEAENWIIDHGGHIAPQDIDEGYFCIVKKT